MLRKSREADFDRLRRVAEAVAFKMAKRFRSCERYIDRDDFMQEAMMGLCEAVNRHDPNGVPLKRYATIICEQRCIDAFRRVVGRRGQYRYAGLTGSRYLASELPQLARDCDRQRRCDLSHEVEDRVRTYPARERAAVRLYFFDGLTMRRVGFVLGLSESRVSQLFAAMRTTDGKIRDGMVAGRTAAGRLPGGGGVGLAPHEGSAQAVAG